MIFWGVGNDVKASDSWKMGRKGKPTMMTPTMIDAPASYTVSPWRIRQRILGTWDVQGVYVAQRATLWRRAFDK